MLKKIKYPGAKEGIIRSDWLNKMVDRVFNSNNIVPINGNIHVQ